MVNTIPCPNPVCTHSFSLAALQSAAQLLCPKCGFRMQGKAPAQAKPALVAKPATIPTSRPVMAQPIAVPSTAKVAVATPVFAKPAAQKPPTASPVAAGDPPISGEESVSDGSFFNPEVGGASGALVRSSSAKRPFSWMRMLIIFFAVGFALSLVIAGFGAVVIYVPGLQPFRELFSRGDAYIGNIKNSKNENEKVYKLTLPKPEWAYDREMVNAFSGPAARDNLVTAWKDTTGYDFWFAVIVKDYGMNKPRDAEMLRIAVEKLEGHFGKDIELGEKAEPAKFAALPAQKLKFRGVVMQATWEGECYMFFNNGISYWLILAAPDRKVVDYFAGRLPEDHVFVVSDRRGWREQPWPTVTFASIDKKLDVTAPEKVWQEGDATKSEYPNAKLLLAGEYRREKDNTKNAILRVFTLDKQADLKAALKAAREQVESCEKESNDKAKVVHATEVVPGQTELGEIKDIGKGRGRVIDLKLMLTGEKDPQRYYLVAVIAEADTAYAIVCECSWTSRQIWRQDFLDVLRTLRVK